MTVKRFSGRVAVVIGATSGIGRATACALAAEGAAVVVAGRRADLLRELVDEIRTGGGEARFVQADVRSASSIAAAMESTVSWYGKMDMAVNNAGVPGGCYSLSEYPEAVWDEVMSVNLKGVWLCMKYEIPYLLQNGGGAIVNTSSDVAFVGSTFGIAPYVASKHGVMGLTRAAALEYANRGIRVNAICPGLTETAIVAPVQQQNPAFLKGHVDACIPMGRMATPAEQAHAIVWLCSSESSFVTGHGLVVDGGTLAR